MVKACIIKVFQGTKKVHKIFKNQKHFHQIKKIKITNRVFCFNLFIHQVFALYTNSNL